MERTNCSQTHATDSYNYEKMLNFTHNKEKYKFKLT